MSRFLTKPSVRPKFSQHLLLYLLKTILDKTLSSHLFKNFYFNFELYLFVHFLDTFNKY